MTDENAKPDVVDQIIQDENAPAWLRAALARLVSIHGVQRAA
jgi:hypothetical protein